MELDGLALETRCEVGKLGHLGAHGRGVGVAQIVKQFIYTLG